MAVSIKSPTSTTGSIQLNGSDVLTIDSSGNLTAPNNLTVTGTVTQTGGATFNGGITGNVAFDTNTLYVDAANNRVGIGTSSPTNNLQIYNNGATSGQIHITNSSTGATATDGVLFGYDGSNDVIINNQEATAMKFNNNGTERMRIDANGILKFDSGYGSVATAYGCRAWVHFDGTTSGPSIRASGNVSSISDQGVGFYMVNFTTAMPDANYSATVTAGSNIGFTRTAAFTTTTLEVRSMNASGTHIDQPNFCVAIVR